MLCELQNQASAEHAVACQSARGPLHALLERNEHKITGIETVFVIFLNLQTIIRISLFNGFWLLFHSSLRTSRVSTHPPSLDLSPSCTEKRSSFFITAKQGKIRIYTFLLYPIFYLQRLHLNLENAQLQVFFFIISNSRRRVCRSGYHTL